MFAKIHRTGAKKAGSILSSLDRLSLRLGSTLDLQMEAAVLLDWIQEAGLATAAVLFLADEAKENLDAVAWRGVTLEAGISIPMREGSVEDVLRLSAVNSLGPDEETFSIPLVIEGEVVGVLCAVRPEGAELPGEECKLWDAAAGLAVAILRNIQRYQYLAKMAGRLAEQKQTERLKDDLISTASHDLKSPVTSMKGYAQLAAKQLRRGDMEKLGECLEVIVKQADQLNGLLDALLDVSRLQAGRLTLYCAEVNLIQLLDEIVERFSGTTDRHRLHVEAPTQNVIGWWDRSRIGQVFANLVGNAIKYSPDGGEIALQIDIHCEEVVVAVSDQGIGIPSPELGQLFDRFYRGQSAINRGLGGSGLGLYISQAVVEAHGGRIWVESEETKGSTFFVALPLTACSPADSHDAI